VPLDTPLSMSPSATPNGKTPHAEISSSGQSCRFAKTPQLNYMRNTLQ
jgi:hypothetical protein